MSILRQVSFALLAALAFAGSPVSAAEKTVRVPADQPTIAKAMETAAPGDTVLVAPGTYTEVLLVKDGVVLRSEGGRDATTIAYGEPPANDQNEAVVSLQNTSNSTQVVGFTIDGRSVAKRGLLVFKNGAPVIADCRVRGCMMGVAMESNAAPYIQDCNIEGCSFAAIFVRGGSGDVKNCDLVNGEKFGLVVEGTTTPLLVRDCRFQNNAEAGVQATDGEFSIVGGSVSFNGNSGLVLQLVRPLIQNVVIEGNRNIGVVLENATGTLQGCTIRKNTFGAVITGTGDPKIFSTTFEDNASVQVSVEGDAVPVIGGSIENANLFLGKTAAAIQSGAKNPINASFNYWGKPFPSKEQFVLLPGGAQVIRKPWVTADLKTSFTDFEAARKHSRTPATEEEAAAAAADAAESEAVTAKQESLKAAEKAKADAAPAPKKTEDSVKAVADSGKSGAEEIKKAADGK